VTEKRAWVGVTLLVVAACGTERWAFDADGGATTDGASGSCTNDGNCKLDTLHCDTVSGQCVPCVVDSQCTTPGLPRCDGALHSCIECGSRGDCSNGRVCDPTAHRCMEWCADGGQCSPSAPICSEPRGVCVACRDDGDCEHSPLGPVCDVAAGQCVDCTSDAQCHYEMPRCDRTSGRCVRCLSSSDCPHEEPICDPVQHTCTDGREDH
jgi:hypothetical protein